MQLRAQTFFNSIEVGNKVEDMRFSGFGSVSCAESHAITVAQDEVAQDRMRGTSSDELDLRTSFERIIFEPSDLPAFHRVNFCLNPESAQRFYAFRDVDGSVLGAGSMGGFAVSDVARITSLIPSDCSRVDGACASFCSGICLRHLKLSVSVLVSDDVVLRIESPWRGGSLVDVHGEVDFGMLHMRRSANPDLSYHEVRCFLLRGFGELHTRF